MKKALILTLVMLMVMSLSAFATSTRTLTLGENNNVLLDDNNIWYYPSRVFQYPNIAVGQFARDNGDGTTYSNTFYNFGVNWKFGEKSPWVLGTYFSAVPALGPRLLELDYPNGYTIPGYDYYYGDALAVPAYTPQNSISTDKRIDLLLAHQFGKYTFGVGFGFTHSSYAYDTTTDMSAASFGYYAFTWSLTPDDGKWDVALMTNFGTFKTTDTANKDLVTPDGYNDIGLQGRYFWKYNNIITFVPHAAIDFGTHGVKYSNADTSRYQPQKTSETAFELGCGMNYRPVNNVLGVLDFGIAYDKVKYEYGAYSEYNGEVYTPVKATEETESEWYFPYWRIGVEGEVFNWLTLRLGARSNWTIYKYAGPYYTPETDKYAENNTYLGLGLNFNRLHIDTYTDPQILLHGFDFISGNTNSYGSPDLNFHVSVLYDMF